VGVHCSIYKRSYNISNISYLNSPLYHSPLPPPPISGIVSTGIMFPFTYMCTQYLQYIHAPMAFTHLLSLPLVPTPYACDCTKKKKTVGNLRPEI
jgi:hypothetical protein